MSHRRFGSITHLNPISRRTKLNRRTRAGVNLHGTDAFNPFTVLETFGRADRNGAHHRPSSTVWKSCVNIKVSIIKDDAGLRESLAVLISGAPGFRLVSVHANAEHALQHIPQATPNVALVGIDLGKMSGIECVRRLKALCPKLQLMMLTVY